MRHSGQMRRCGKVCTVRREGGVRQSLLERRRGGGRISRWGQRHAAALLDDGPVSNRGAQQG